ncbi:Nn.00g101340.m01.CDS01 [Neocucurbitaria sp. VM-36]
MPKYVSDDDEPLEDKTAALTLKNKRTERMKRKDATRQQKRDAIVNLTKLPTELILESLRYLEPHDVFNFSFVNRRFLGLVDANANVLGDSIIQRRYTILSQCFPKPKLLADMEDHIRALLTDPNRQNQLSIHKRPYQHIQSPDAHELCTCLTCILTWNNLGLVLDFAHWQTHLDTGEPIPIIPRGTTPEWNIELVARNARIARKAVENSLWYARILQLHLDSTIRSIRRHGQNKGNKRTHVAMTQSDAESGTDSFLSKHGPPSIEFPYQRDEYYMLEAYLPNRWWKKVEGRWIYNIAGHHERDIELVQRLARR